MPDLGVLLPIFEAERIEQLGLDDGRLSTATDHSVDILEATTTSYTNDTLGAAGDYVIAMTLLGLNPSTHTMIRKDNQLTLPFTGPSEARLAAHLHLLGYVSPDVQAKIGPNFDCDRVDLTLALNRLPQDALSTHYLGSVVLDPVTGPEGQYPYIEYRGPAEKARLKEAYINFGHACLIEAIVPHHLDVVGMFQKYEDAVAEPAKIPLWQIGKLIFGH